MKGYAIETLTYLVEEHAMCVTLTRLIHILRKLAALLQPQLGPLYNKTANSDGPINPDAIATTPKPAIAATMVSDLLRNPPVAAKMPDPAHQMILFFNFFIFQIFACTL